MPELHVLKNVLENVLNVMPLFSSIQGGACCKNHDVELNPDGAPWES